MKYFFATCLVIFLSTNAFSEMRVIENKKIGANDEMFDMWVTTLCIDGYKFVLARDVNSKSLSIVQYYENRGNVADVPDRC